VSVLLETPDHTAHPPVYGLFETSFLTHDGEDGYGANLGDALLMGNMFPAFLGTSAFTGVGNTTLATIGGSAGADPLTNPENYRRSRIHFGTGHLLSDHPAFPIPEETTEAHMLLEEDGDNPALYFEGDNTPKFSRDASLRAFFRRPLNHGRHIQEHHHFFDVGIRLWNQGGDFKDATLLWHGSDHSKDRPNPIKYSNLIGGIVTDPTDPATHEDLWGGEKDRRERFLDETYRYRSDFRRLDGNLSLSLKETETLCGPGLPHGTLTNLHVPVRLEDISGTLWEPLHWLTSKSHTVFLNDLAQRLELQVAGWPDRNPSIRCGVAETTLDSGVLIYPQHNFYENTLPPQKPEADYSDIPDNDVADGVAPERSWVRAFNCQHKMVGTHLVDLEIAGLQLSNFAWDTNPTPGSHEMAILIKVPGLTTWMDVGRRDGEGPSKQDPFADGAGCMVVGPNTKDMTPWPKMGIKRCAVRCNLGPSAELFAGPNGAVILVKVVMYSKAGRYLNLEQGGSEGKPQILEGLCRLQVQGVK